MDTYNEDKFEYQAEPSIELRVGKWNKFFNAKTRENVRIEKHETPIQ